MTETPNKQALTVVFAWSIFQSGKGKKRSAPKLDPIISQLSSRSEFKIIFRNHIETFAPLRSRYGVHALSKVLDSALLAQSLAHAMVDLRAEILSANGLRKVWRETRRMFWTRHLKRTGSRALIGANLTHEQIRACQALGIPSLEVQHGIMDVNWYLSFWSQVAPTHLACWPNTRELVKTHLSPELLTIPYPVSNSLQGGLDRPEIRSGKELLVILSWGVEDSLDKFGGIPMPLVPAINQLSSKYSRVRFRLHPVMRSRDARGLAAFLQERFPEKSIEYTRRRSLVDSLSECDAVLMSGSSSWVESVLLGKLTYTTSELEYKMALSLADQIGLPAGRVVLWPGGEGTSKSSRAEQVSKRAGSMFTNWGSLHLFLDSLLPGN